MANRPEINKRGPPSIGYKRVTLGPPRRYVKYPAVETTAWVTDKAKKSPVVDITKNVDICPECENTVTDNDNGLNCED